MAECKSCKQPALWAKFRDSGRFVLLDPEPVPGGNLGMRTGANYSDGIPRVWIVKPAELEGHPVQLGLDPEDDRPLAWRAHFASCPDSEHHRRRKA